MLGTAFACALLGPLASASVYDLHERRIPNKLVAVTAAFWCVLCAAWLVVSGGATEAWSFAERGLVGALCLGGGSFLVASVFERFTGRASFGGGDVKLLFVIGLYVGLFGGLLCLMVACVAAVVLAFVMPRTRFAHVPGSIAGGIPFAPALFAGTLFALL